MKQRVIDSAVTSEAWRDDHRQQRLVYGKQWRAENQNPIKEAQRRRDRAEKELKPEAA